MPAEVFIPSLGEVVESVKILNWFKSEGDFVEKGEILLEVESEKVTMGIEAPVSGIVAKILFPEGSRVPIAQVVGLILAEGEKIPHTYAGAGISPKVMEEAREGAVKDMQATKSGRDRIRTAPVARKMAERHGIDLSQVTPTGPDGTIMKKDVQAYLAATKERLAATPPVVAGEGEGEMERVSDGGSRIDSVKTEWERIPIRGARRVIFENMVQSLSQTAQLTLHTEACAEALISLHQRLSDNDQQVSYNAIFLKIAAMALRRHSRINASVEGDTIRIWKQIHIGLAMESNDVLMAPVIRNADMKTIREINREVTELVRKAREGRFSPDDLAYGTFTITNLGYGDVDHFTPILRPPESGILGVGRIEKKAVVKGEQVVPEARVGLSLTFDHRIIDGAPAARFLKTIKEMVEDPVMMIS